MKLLNVIENLLEYFLLGLFLFILTSSSHFKSSTSAFSLPFDVCEARCWFCTDPVQNLEDFMESADYQLLVVSWQGKY